MAARRRYASEIIARRNRVGAPEGRIDERAVAEPGRSSARSPPCAFSSAPLGPQYDSCAPMPALASYRTSPCPPTLNALCPHPRPSPAFARSPSPASSSSWPRPHAAATATAIRTGATSARASPRPARFRARRPRVDASRSARTTRTTRRSPGSGSCASAVAELYNELYRRTRPRSTPSENVCICGGGRASPHPRGRRAG